MRHARVGVLQRPWLANSERIARAFSGYFFKTKIDTHDICCTLYVANSIQMLCKALALSRAANRVSCLAGCAGCAVLHHWVHEANHNSRVTFLVKVYFRTMFDDYFLPTLTIRPPPQRLLYISFLFFGARFSFLPFSAGNKGGRVQGRATICGF